jgi:hypothetical protein
MATSQRSSIPAELRYLIPTRWLNAAAGESGLVVRHRKVAPAALFWTLVLGFAVGHRRSLASLRRSFQASTGVGVVPSSFYDRLTANTVRFLRRALPRAGRGVRHHHGAPAREVREDVLLGARVGGVVAEHEEVDGRVLREAARARPVVDRRPDGADLPLLLEPPELVERPLVLATGVAHPPARPPAITVHCR